MSNTEQKPKEVDLTKRLSRILEAIPAYCLRNLITTIAQTTMAGVNNQSDRDSLDITAEHEEGRNRYDVCVPLTLGDVRKVIFEAKLETPDAEQLNRYAQAEPNAIIVSIVKTHGSPGINLDDRVVSLTWNDIAYALLSMTRSPLLAAFISAIDAPLEGDGVTSEYAIQVVPPRGYIGRDAELRIEDFVHSLLDGGLATLRGRVMVVTGKKAVDTTQERNVYALGHKWNQGFDIVVVVYDKKVQYIGRVTARGILPNSEKKLKGFDESDISALVAQHSESAGMSPIVKLEPWFSRRDGQTTCPQPYREHVKHVITSDWPAGAFTQSHRYFDSFQAFSTVWCRLTK